MTARLWIAGLLTLAGGAGIYLATIGETKDTDFVPQSANSERRDDRPPEVRGGDAVGRRGTNVEEPVAEAKAGEDDIESLLGLNDRDDIVVVGRVIDSNEVPVAGARVAVTAQIDPGAIFQRMQDGDMPDPRQLFESMGGGRGMMNRARDLMGGESVGETVATDRDGRFQVSGVARTEGNLQLLVQHPDFAPASATKRFNLAEADGDIVLDDVVVDAGVTATGRVIDSNGRAVPGAVVALDGPGGGFGGFGRGRGGRGGFPGFGGDARAEAIPTLETDSGGYFRFEHLPGDRIQIRAEARGYTIGRSERAETSDKSEVDLGDIQLGDGAILRGLVTDARGEPIEGARVSGSFSRDTFQQRTEGLERDEVRAQRQLVATFFRASQDVETDADGRFELDKVPAAALEVQIEHERYIDRTLEPVDPTTGAELTIVLNDLLLARGTVVDAGTGAPVEKFAISARKIDDDPFAALLGRGGAPGQRPGRGGRGGRTPNADQGEENPEQVARQIEREQRDAAREALLGGSGRMPGRTEAPTAHPGGRFELEGLQPGVYVFDIDAPGYVKIAAGEVALKQGEEVPDFRFEVTSGVAVRGVVVDEREGRPVAGARVSLRFPDDGQDNGGFGGFGRGRGGFGRGGRPIQSVRTDDAGRYELQPQLPGDYALHVDAQDFPGYRDEAFVLRGQGVFDFDIQLTNGTHLFGAVKGLEEGQNARVVLTHTETNERRTVRVDRETMEYDVTGLAAGGYFASVELRGAGDRDWRARVGAFVASRTGDPDFFVPEGGELRYDLDAAALELPTVRGQILKNGLASAGLNVRLVALSLDDTGNDPQAGRRLAGLLSSGVDGETGNFEISSVPPGEYRLEVLAGGGGGRGRGGPRLGRGGPALGSQEISVRKGGDADVFLNVQTGALALRVVDANGEALTSTGRLRLVRADESYGLEPDQWNGLDSLQTTRLRNGSLDIEAAPIGAWRAEVFVPGFERKVADFQILAQDAATEVRIELAPSQDGN